MDETTDLDAFDAHSAKPTPPWDGVMTPSWSRFYGRYESLQETQLLARWLADASNTPIDVVPNNQGKWVFSDRSRKISDRFYDGINASLNAKIDAEQEQIDIEIDAREKEVDNLMTSWVLYPSSYVHRE